MGDIADDLIDQMMHGPDRRFWGDEDEEYPVRKKRRDLVCHKCGERNLSWVRTRQGYELGTLDGVVHECKEQLPNPEGFE